MARAAKLNVAICGQSHALMFHNGNDTNDTGRAESGSVRLQRRLGALLPGCTVTVRGADNQSYKADTPTFTEYLGDSASAFYTGNPFANQTAGAAQRSYITGGKDAGALGVVAYVMQSQDAKDAGFTASGWTRYLASLIDAVAGDNASGWADFAILPVLPGIRGDSDNTRFSAFRRAWEAAAGTVPAYENMVRKAAVLRPVYNVAHIPLANYSGGGDWTHTIRSTNLRYADAMAIRIANWAGGVPPVPDQARLARAVMLDGTTLRASFACGRQPLGLLWNMVASMSGFALTTGTVSAVAAPSIANAAATGYFTIDLTVSGVAPGSRLTFRAGTGAASFANGSTPPRGALGNIASTLSQGTVLMGVTDAAEDVNLGDEYWSVPVAQTDYGVPVEFP